MTLTEAHRELHKWLNEEQTKPVDREALATVLWAVAATAQEPVQPTSAEYAQGYAEGFNDACRPPQPAISIDALVAEFEATPKGLTAMQEGRQWVRETLVQPVQPAEKTLREAVTLALDALCDVAFALPVESKTRKSAVAAELALRSAIAQPVQPS